MHTSSGTGEECADPGVLRLPQAGRGRETCARRDASRPRATAAAVWTYVCWECTATDCAAIRFGTTCRKTGHLPPDFHAAVGGARAAPTHRACRPSGRTSAVHSSCLQAPHTRGLTRGGRHACAVCGRKHAGIHHLCRRCPRCLSCSSCGAGGQEKDACTERQRQAEPPLAPRPVRASPTARR